jgi:DNA polymerase-3 subunit delta'
LRLEDLVGQERAVAVLRNALRRDRVAHAYLFSGPEAVGKSTAAFLFAQVLNCEAEGDETPCGTCRSCKLIERGSHPDVRLVTVGADARGRRRTEISIDQIRQNPRKPRESPLPLIQDASLKAAMGPHKVYLIDPADRMRAEASNALLKLLEEPPPHVVIILVTSEPSGLLPTVVSRCQQVIFRLAGGDDIEEHLVKLGTAPAVATSLARLSGGRIAWAIRGARRPELLEARTALLDVCADIGRHGLPASLRIAEEIKLQAAQLAQADSETEQEGEEDATPAAARGDRAVREELPWCLDIMVSWYRDLLAIGEGSPLLNPDYEKALKRQFRPQLVAQSQCAVESILETKHAIQRNANIDVALESLVIGLVGACD